MKVKKVYLNDDDILVAGHLIERPFHKPVFYPFDGRCGFSSQTVHNRKDLITFSDAAYRAFYQEHYRPGMDIRVMQLGNEPMRFPVGTVVHVIKVDDGPQIHCSYGNKNRINLIPGIDTFQKIYGRRCHDENYES